MNLRLFFLVLSMLVGGAAGLQLDHGWSMVEIPLEPIATPELARQLFRDGKVDEAYLRAAACVTDDPTCRALAIQLKQFIVDSRPLERKSMAQLEKLMGLAMAIGAGQDGSKPVAAVKAAMIARLESGRSDAIIEPEREYTPEPWTGSSHRASEAEAAALASQRPHDRGEALSIAMRVFYMTEPGSQLRQWAEQQLKMLRADR